MLWGGHSTPTVRNPKYKLWHHHYTPPGGAGRAAKEARPQPGTVKRSPPAQGVWQQAPSRPPRKTPANAALAQGERLGRAGAAAAAGSTPGPAARSGMSAAWQHNREQVTSAPAVALLQEASVQASDAALPQEKKKKKNNKSLLLTLPLQELGGPRMLKVQTALQNMGR